MTFLFFLFFKVSQHTSQNGSKKKKLYFPRKKIKKKRVTEQLRVFEFDSQKKKKKKAFEFKKTKNKIKK